MSYQVLARKWRPKTFAELVGQEHVVRALSNALVQQRLHHAYLLTGTRGVGKTTLARILAKSLNCETGITAEPCGQCGTCREIDMGRYVDLLELDAASNTGVDNMREVLDNAQYAPTAGRFKVYLIDEVHMLSKGAFNSMLKTLEEPPAHVKFILATTDPQKIPVTVLSRCLQFNLKHLPPKEIEGQLTKVLGQEGIPFEAPAVALIARAAQGSMRDALSLLDQAIAYGSGKVEEAQVRDMLGTIDQGYLFALLDHLAHQDGPALIRTAEAMQERALSFEAALQDLGTLLHRVALAQTVPEAIAEDEPERAQLMALAQAFSPEEVQLYYQIALQGRRDLYLAPDEYAGFTMALMRMLAFAPQQAPESGGRGSGKTTGSVPPPARPRTTMAPPEATTQTVHETPAPATRNAANAADWPGLVEKLRLGGMARMLAQHCELKTHADNQWQLTVPAAHKHLADKPYLDKLVAALSEHFGTPQKITLDIGGGNGMTPVEVGERRRQELQAGAVAAIEQDPIVREIIETFDARIIENSIRPIQ